MSSRSTLIARFATRRKVGIAAFSLLGLCAAGAQAQVEDWQSNVSSCVPANAYTLNAGQVIIAGGYVRAPLGPNPPLIYTCNVLDSFAAVVPNWNFLRLQYNAPVNGAVTAALYAKNKVTGVAVLQATAVSVAAGAVSNVQVGLPALNFAVNSHYIVVTVNTLPNFRVQAHMVTTAQ
ncbi:MAG TPA: hypothetical protein VLA16_03360 [Ideonella sp.]|nr:hypothetical protein [Ideonella sp.]